MMYVQSLMLQDFSHSSAEWEGDITTHLEPVIVQKVTFANVFYKFEDYSV